MTKGTKRMERKVDGIVFDKDGTLFDFHATWGVWGRQTIEFLAGKHQVSVVAVAGAIEFDLKENVFLPTSPAIAATNREVAECIARALPDASVDDVEQYLMISAAEAPLSPAVPLVQFLEGLSSEGIALGVMTNDSEFGARAHLSSAGVLDHFDFVAGFDSGFGAKPAPGPLLAFARAAELDPSRVLMVGDSAHDLIAGRAAGMQTFGVLTGTATEQDLQPYADAVSPDIGHIPDWLHR